MLNVTVNIHFDASKRQSEPPVFSHPCPPPQPSSLLSPSRPFLAASPALVPFVPVAAVFGHLLSPSRPCLAAIPPPHATNPAAPLRACRSFLPLSLPLNQKSRKTFGRIKKSPYLCSVKIKETTPDATTQTFQTTQTVKQLKNIQLCTQSHSSPQ